MVSFEQDAGAGSTTRRRTEVDRHGQRDGVVERVDDADVRGSAVERADLF